MRILLADDSRKSNAHYFIRMGLCRAFAGCGHDVAIWDIFNKSAIDMFDEFKPEVVWIQSYNLNKGLIKAIKEYNPRVIMTGSDWSDYSDSIDIVKYPIVRASQEEVLNVETLLKETGKPDFICCHYHENTITKTHHKWKDKLGIDIHGIPPAADIQDYVGGKYNEDFASDVCFVGGKWGYKGQTINKWFIPLCSPDLNLNIKIFGNRSWGIPQYCGHLDTQYVKHALASAKVCPNISEPHAQVYGHELNERCFKLLSNKCPVVSDYTESLATDIFNNGEIEFAKTPEEFKAKCLAVINGELTINTQKGYDKVMNTETYFSRVTTVFDLLNLKLQSITSKMAYKNIRKQYDI